MRVVLLLLCAVLSAQAHASRECLAADASAWTGTSAWTTGAVTITAWVYRQSDWSGTARFAYLENTSTSSLARIEAADTEAVVGVLFNDGAAGFAFPSPAGTIALNTWTHVGVGLSADRMTEKAWRDGTAATESEDLSGTMTFPDEFGICGGDGDDHLVAHVAVYDSLLSDGDMSNLAGGDNPLTISGLLAYYVMTSDDGSTIPDGAGSNDLTLSGTSDYDANNPTVDAPPSSGPTIPIIMHHKRMQEE